MSTRKPRFAAAALALFSAFSILVASAVAPAHAGPAARKGKIPRMGKPSAPVEFLYEVTGNGQPGTQVTVKVGARFLAAGQDITLELTPGQGLEAGSGEFQSSLASQGGGDVVYRTVTVTSRTSELAYLNVVARGTFNGSPMARVGSIPVTAPQASIGNVRTGSAKVQGGSGASSASTPGSVKKDSSGEDVISMPAQETR